jgi:hypothetical protein
MKLLPLALLAFALVMSGCPQNLGRPTAAPLGDEAPVNLRQLQIVQTADGRRAVLLRLSRQPTLVRHSSARDPGRISIEAWGPVGDGDLPERSLEQSDVEIGGVRVSRKDGALQIILDFRFSEPPTYSVHEMADWIMIRLNTTPPAAG